MLRPQAWFASELRDSTCEVHWGIFLGSFALRWQTGCQCCWSRPSSFISEHAPWWGRQDVRLAQSTGTHQRWDLSLIFFSCVMLPNQDTINGNVIGGTCLCFISAGDCILKHLSTLLSFIMDMLSKCCYNVSCLPNLFTSKTPRGSEFHKSLIARKVSTVICIILWKQFLECCD